MTDAVVPSWEGVRERRWRACSVVDVKLVIAVLIGVVSVTGAFITWKSSQLGEQATDKDRQAIAEIGAAGAEQGQRRDAAQATNRKRSCSTRNS